MNKLDFEQVENTFKSNIKDADLIISEISEIEIKSTTIEILSNYKLRLSKIQSSMDRLLKIESYHLIGMGNLSGSQLLKLAKLIKIAGLNEDKIKRSLSLIMNYIAIVNTTLSDSIYESSQFNLKFKKSSSLI